MWFCCSLLVLSEYLYFFFFKQKTAYEMRISDWSSDVCSSDLRARRWRGHPPFQAARRPGRCWRDHRHRAEPRCRADRGRTGRGRRAPATCSEEPSPGEDALRPEGVGARGLCSSEESRVGKECVSTGRFGGSP